MKVLLAPDSFKQCLPASAVADALATGLSRAWPQLEILKRPMADGGDGTIDALQAASSGELRWCRAPNAYQQLIDCPWLWLADSRTAIIEMAVVNGLAGLKPAQLKPMHASSYGTGVMVAAAAAAGAQKIVLGLGGSATNDCGAGLLQALGYSFVNKRDEVLPTPVTAQDLLTVKSLRAPARKHALQASIEIASDVDNPLLGADGATNTFGLQKGADAAVLITLEQALARFADVAEQALGRDCRTRAGAGAAGGLGWALMLAFNATSRSGAAFVAEAIDLPARIKQADLVITGEGRLDQQTLHGKAPNYVATLARARQKPVMAVGGSVDKASLAQLEQGFDAVHAISNESMSLEESIARAAELLTACGERIGLALRDNYNTSAARSDWS